MRIKARSAGIVIVKKGDHHWDFLLLRCYRYWDFPKGVIEAGEEPIQAAIRETREETTLTDLDFRWGHAYMETEPYGQGKVARYYIAATNTTEISLPINPQLGRPEHHEFRWADYEEALTLLPPRLFIVLKWAHDFTLQN